MHGKPYDPRMHRTLVDDDLRDWISNLSRGEMIDISKLYIADKLVKLNGDPDGCQFALDMIEVYLPLSVSKSGKGRDELVRAIAHEIHDQVTTETSMPPHNRKAQAQAEPGADGGGHGLP